MKDKKYRDLLLQTLKQEKQDTLGDILKYVRKCSFMTQKELGEELGITRQQIQKYEYNIFKPSPKRLQEILNICDDVYMDFYTLIKNYYI